jgi:hypothetical protein
MRVNREFVCPTLIRCFISVGRNHPISYFENGSTPADKGATELAIYTWPDATLFELAELVREKVELSRTKVMIGGSRAFPALGFSLVYPDKTGIFCIKTGGVAEAGGPDEKRTLHELGWEQGDYLDVAVFDTTRPRGPPPAPNDRRRDGGGGGGGGGGGRRR